MKTQRSALFAILFLAGIVIGCTSSTPDPAESGNAVTTTKTVNQTGDRLEPTLTSSSDTDERFINSMRQWRDRENQYSTNAELVSVSIKNRSIKLLKDNGITIDVSIDRLSEHDRNFLTQAVHALRDELVR